MDPVIIALIVVIAVLASVGLIVFVVLRGKKKNADADTSVARDNPETKKAAAQQAAGSAPEAAGGAPAATDEQSAPVVTTDEAAGHAREKESKTANALDGKEREIANAPADKANEVSAPAEEGAKPRRFAIRYNKSFLAKLIQSDERTKRYYSEIKTKLLLCEGVKSRITWKYETFRKGRKTLAKLRLRGKTLSLALALDPKDYAETEYRVESLAEIKSYALTPCLYRIKNNRRLAYAKELIEELATRNNLTENTAGENTDYAAQYPYEETDALIARGLIKVLNGKGAQRSAAFKPSEEKPEPEAVEEPKAAEPEESAEPEVIEEEPKVAEPEEITEPDTVEEEPKVEPEAVEKETEPEVVEEPEEEPEIAEPEVRTEVAATEVDKIMSDEVAASLIEKTDGKTDKTKQGIINIDTLSQSFKSGETVTLAEIKKRIKGYQKTTYIKVLARGTLDKPLTVEADTFSIQAVKMIVLTGGKAVKKR